MADTANIDPLEIWKPVVGFEGLYSVSNLGRVRSESRRVPFFNHRSQRLTTYTVKGRIMTLCTQGRGGYPTASLSNGETHGHSVHIMVAAAFIGPRPIGMQIAHLNGNPTDNRPANLIYATPKENNGHKAAHGTLVFGEGISNSRLTDESVRALRRENRSNMSWRQLGIKYGVSKITARAAFLRLTWRHV